MTDKEQFDLVKADKLERRRKLRVLKMLRTNINTKLKFGISLNDEDKVANLLAQLSEVDKRELIVRGNKYNSNFYSFE